MKYPRKQTYAALATTDKPGIVRKATAAEAAAGTVTDAFVTPADLDAAVDALIEPASTTVAGVIEIATDAEAIAKTATDKALVPSNLAAIGASATFAGLIEIATDAEAIAKTATDKAIVPSNLAALGSSATFAGLIEIATDAEAIAKTATDRAIVPSNLAAIGASATFAGLIEIATDAEAIAASATDRAIVPSNLAALTATNLTALSASDSDAQAKTSVAVFLTPANLAAEGFLQWADVVLTSAEVKALAATQIELVAAQGAGSAIQFMGAVLKLNYGGTNVFTEAGDNLAIKYTDDTGVQVCTTIEMTGFIDQTADTYTNAVVKADNIVVATAAENQALVLDNLGSEIAGNAANDNTLSVRVYYVVQSI